MPACPQTSGLPQFCVGGQLSPAICDPSGLEANDIRVVARLVDNAGNDATGITDPNGCIEFLTTRVEEIHTSGNGCWCVCLPFANYSSVDPLNAVYPATTQWEIRLFIGDAAEGIWTGVGQARTFQIDADFDYDAACGGCAPLATTCGSCIPITCLLAPTGTLPMTVDNAWCDAVLGCVQPSIDDLQSQINALVDENTVITSVAITPSGTDLELTITDSDGTPHTGTISCDDLATFLQQCWDTDVQLQVDPDDPTAIVVVNGDGDVLGDSVTICELIAALDQPTDIPENVKLVGYDPDGNECGLYDPPDAGTTTVVGHGGDTFPYDVTLPDGTVLSAGDEVPDGVVVIVEQNPDGTSISAENSFETLNCCYQNWEAYDEDGNPVRVLYNTATGEPTCLDGVTLAVLDPCPTLVNPSTDPPDPTDPCTESAGGLTGEPSGAFIDGCTIETVADASDPEADYPAASFPEGWRQMFNDGASNGTKTYITQTAPNGDMQWEPMT